MATGSHPHLTRRDPDQATTLPNPEEPPLHRPFIVEIQGGSGAPRGTVNSRRRSGILHGNQPPSRITRPVLPARRISRDNGTMDDRSQGTDAPTTIEPGEERKVLTGDGSRLGSRRSALAIVATQEESSDD